MPMIRYWNFYLSKEQNAYFRVRYNLMQAIGEVGGIMGVFGTVLVYILMPCYYYKNEVEVMLELENRTKNHNSKNRIKDVNI